MPADDLLSHGFELLSTVSPARCSFCEVEVDVSKIHIHLHPTHKEGRRHAHYADRCRTIQRLLMMMGWQLEPETASIQNKKSTCNCQLVSPQDNHWTDAVEHKRRRANLPNDEGKPLTKDEQEVFKRHGRKPVATQKKLATSIC